LDNHFSKYLIMNLEHIAQIAGVSRSTVSRVINNDPYVSQQTRSRVMTIIEAEGYIPHPAARSLATRRTQAIGLLIPQTFSAIFSESLYLPTLLQGISRAANQANYALMLWIDHGAETTSALPDMVAKNRMADGYIIASPTTDGELIRGLIERNVLFVSADRLDYIDPHTNFVTVENVQSSRAAIEHLIELGRRRIACITPRNPVIDMLDRIDGYRMALEAAGIAYDPDLVLETGVDYEAGYAAGKALYQRGVDAIFALVDTIALGAISGIRDAGGSVPHDVAVIGFDDLPVPHHGNVLLSTIRQPVEEKGYQLAQVLIDLIEEKRQAPVQKYLPASLIVRETCGGSFTEQRIRAVLPD
jgi:LacI family transcriptional regulator